MAIFRKKSGDKESATEPVVFKPDPAKAAKWFEHAKAMADSHQWASALVYYAHGLQLDPGSLKGQEGILQIAPRHLQNGGKRLTKEIKKLDGPNPIDKMAAAILAWTSEFNNPSLGVKVLDAAIIAGQIEFANQLTERIFLQVKSAKKVNRNLLLQVKELSAKCNSWDVAMLAGSTALEMDPSDSKLDDEIKELSAQRAMSKGGYDKAAGKEGGFREFIKDSKKQQELTQEDSLAGAGGARESVLERAKAAYEKNPEAPDVLNRYAQLLRREGTPDSIEEAERVYRLGHEATGEYRFRMNAGDLAISRHRNAVSELKTELESAPESEASAVQNRLEKAEEKLLELEASEFAERAKKYPTDRTLKFQLGDVAFRRGDLGTAMECFQKSKDEPKLRTRAGHYLGRCFAQEDWHAEAIAEFRETLEKIEPGDQERELEIRYDLMKSLIAMARTERSSEDARDALEICSWIARKDITYRDIRDRRKEIDQLVREIG
ncbi:MAG: hypothetical protein MK089_01745 [Phycisphaerales bacterium]|nr:hypothetical protein [Phycisphaerales bacterium]